MVSSSKKHLTDLQFFLGVIATLVVIGLIFVYSSSSVYALEKHGSAFFFVRKQLIGLALGLIGLFVAWIFPLKIIRFLSPIIFLFFLVLTSMTRFSPFALRVHGSSRWLTFFGFTFQPSEILKLALIVYVASFIAKKVNTRHSFWKSYAPLVIVVGITSLVLLSQPDFGLTVTLCCSIFILLYVAHFPGQYLLITLAGLIPAAITLIYLKPYRFQRILTF